MGLTWTLLFLFHHSELRAQEQLPDRPPEESSFGEMGPPEIVPPVEPVEEMDQLELITTSPPRLLERGANHDFVEFSQEFRRPDGETVTRTSRFTQLEDGLNYEVEPGVFEPASDELDIVEGEAVGLRAQHKVRLKASPDEPGAVQLDLPTGERLVSRVFGLAYLDTGTGQAELLAEVRPAEGWVSSNQVVYPLAFNEPQGVQADLRYTFGKARFEQDVILRRAPRPPQDFGMNPATTQLEVWTEFEQAPEPVREPSPLLVSTSEGDWEVANETLSFGGTRMARGVAFAIGDASGSLAPVEVAKTWLETQDEAGLLRRFLVEAVPVPVVAADLDRLAQSPGTASVRRGKREALLAKGRTSPAKDQTVAGLRRAQHERWLALNGGPGFVVDYVTINTTYTNYSLGGASTYYLTGPVTMTAPSNGSTKFEGGAVLKFKSSVGAKLVLQGPINWTRVTAYRPVILTAQDDDSVGEKISGSSGTPTSGAFYADTGLEFEGTAAATNCSLSHLRIAYAQTGLTFRNTTNSGVRHVQIVNAQTAFQVTNATARVQNALAWNESAWLTTNTATFRGAGAVAHVEFMTADGGNWFNYSNSIGTLNVTNSLLYTITNHGTISSLNAVYAPSTNPGPFHVVQAGRHYLLNDTYRNLGTSTIDPSLTNELATMTTHPPAILAGFSSGASTVVLDRITPRDDDGFWDCGYHYLALDYMSRRIALETGGMTVVMTNGAALAFYGQSAFRLRDQSEFHMAGTPTSLSRLCFYPSVQEHPVKLAGVDPNAIFDLIYAGSASGVSRPILKLRFLDVAMLGVSMPFFGDGSRTFAVADQLELLDAVDTQFRGVAIVAQSTNDFWQGVNPPLLSFENCAFATSTLDVRKEAVSNGGSWVDNPYEIVLMQNLLWSSSINMYYGMINSSSAPPWEIRRNMFNSGSFLLNGDGNWTNQVDRSHNGFMGNPGGFAANDPTGSDTGATNGVTFGIMGERLWYVNSPTNLWDAAGVLASSVGMYHYTTRTSQAKEGTSTNDLGFHYVALDGNGLPIDTDGDGLADYLEDSNGNGTYESGSDLSDWTNANTDGDAVSDGAEVRLGTDPKTNETATSGERVNYTYDKVGRLETVTGKRSETITVDKESNVVGAQ